VARRTLTADQAELLHGKTEGWPAGLQLAALSLRGRPDLDPFLATFAGDDRAVADYLTEEVLQRQSERVQRFLLQTSVLERLNGSLCDAVVGGTGSHRLLEQLDRQSLFVHRLDNTRQWFRYHRLFQDLLRYRLRILDAQLERNLLSRAAEWQLANGALEPAARYLIAAGEWTRIEALVEERGRELFEAGRAAEAARWLDAVPRDRVREAPRTALMRAFLHSTSGVPLVAAQELDDLEAGDQLTVGEETVLMTFRAAWAQYHAAPSQVVDWAERALELLNVVDPSSIPDILGLTGAADLHFAALVSRARALAYLGSTGRARSEMHALLVETNAIKPVWMVHLLGSVALLESWSGNLHVAHSFASRALDMAHDGKLTTQGATADAYLAMACVARERNRLAEAEHFLDEALTGAALNRRHVLLGAHAGERALTALAKGEPERGLAVLDQYQSEGHPPPPPAVADRLLGARVRLLVARGDLEWALQLVAETPGRSAHVSAAATSAAVAGDRLDLATELVAGWPPGETRDGLEHELWSAVLDDLGGHRQHAVKRMAGVVAGAGQHGHLRLFLDNGAPVLRLVRAVFHERPSSYLRTLLEPAPEPARTQGEHRRGRPLTVPLSDRERIVLGYLPSRLSNAEIARQLYISVNTLKTHLRRIYDKLEVGDRNAAVSRAENLGLV
jgi:LuxR family maltose regulon positive regulatory protein